jgi:hypothetical protein
MRAPATRKVAAALRTEAADRAATLQPADRERVEAGDERRAARHHPVDRREPRRAHGRVPAGQRIPETRRHPMELRRTPVVQLALPPAAGPTPEARWAAMAALRGAVAVHRRAVRQESVEPAAAAAAARRQAGLAGRVQAELAAARRAGRVDRMRARRTAASPRFLAARRRASAAAEFSVRGSCAIELVVNCGSSPSSCEHAPSGPIN